MQQLTNREKQSTSQSHNSQVFYFDYDQKKKKIKKKKIKRSFVFDVYFQSAHIYPKKTIAAVIGSLRAKAHNPGNS